MIMEIVKVDVLSNQLKALESDVINGNADALEVMCQTKVLEKKLVDFNKTIGGHAKDEAAKYGEKSFGAFGRSIEMRNGAAMPQFKDDDAWAALKEQLKEREELLKVALKSKDTIYDSDGVEVPKVSVTYRADSLIVK